MEMVTGILSGLCIAAGGRLGGRGIEHYRSRPAKQDQPAGGDVRHDDFLDQPGQIGRQPGHDVKRQPFFVSAADLVGKYRGKRAADNAKHNKQGRVMT